MLLYLSNHGDALSTESGAKQSKKENTDKKNI